MLTHFARVYGWPGEDAEALTRVDVLTSAGMPDHAVPVPRIRAQAARRAGRYAEAAGQFLKLLPPSDHAREAAMQINKVHAAFGGEVPRSQGLSALRSLAEAGPVPPVGSLT